MDNSSAAGWILMIAGILLLAGFGRLDLLAILIPVSILLACGFACMGDNRIKPNLDGKHRA